MTGTAKGESPSLHLQYNMINTDIQGGKTMRKIFLKESMRFVINIIVVIGLALIIGRMIGGV